MEGRAPASTDADAAVTALYGSHYAALVRTAGLMLRDRAAAEEVVQDAYVGLYRNWTSLRDTEKAVAYLRRSTVNGVRSVQRRAVTADRAAPRLRPVSDAADHADSVGDRDAVMSALAALPDRQREVLVLRYYGDLSENDIAEALGISRGAVKTHASRGIAALRPVLEQVR